MSLTEIAQQRYEMGADILLNIQSNDDLPQPNKYRLAKVMQEYYLDGDYAVSLEEQGLKWQGSEGYWHRHLAEISDALAKGKRQYFAYIVKPGEALREGSWRFCAKAEYEEYLKREHKGIGTHVDHHNEKLENAKLRWKMDLPALAEVPQLTAN